MAWQIEFAEAAARELAKLDPPSARRILKFLRERVAPHRNNAFVFVLAVALDL